MTRIAIAAFIAAVVLYFVSLYVYIPILPAFVAGRTPTLAAVGIVLAMYGLWTAVLRMPMGIAADATGRNRPFLVLGTLMAGAGAAVMLAGRSLGTLALGRAFTGVAAAAWVPMMAVFAGYFAPRQAIFATSLLSFASSLGQMIGTGSTGLVESLGGYGLTFVAAVGFSILASLIFLIVKIPKSAERRPEPLSGRSILAVARRRDVIVPSLTNALCQFGVWALTFGFMPLLAARMGAGAGATGLIMTLNIAANTAANLFATLIANRGGRRPLLYLSFAVFAGGAMLAAFGATLPFLFVSTVLMGLANGLFFPILLGLSIQRVDTAQRSTAMGIHQAVYAVGMFTGPWVGGIVADALGIRAMFAIVAAFSFVGPGSLFLLYRDPVKEG
ncbi:MAG: MFS transporter [Treponema sp.]|nr:MFS transporter [Treponema sp.]